MIHAPAPIADAQRYALAADLAQDAADILAALADASREAWAPFDAILAKALAEIEA